MPGGSLEVKLEQAVPESTCAGGRPSLGRVVTIGVAVGEPKLYGGAQHLRVSIPGGVRPTCAQGGGLGVGLLAKEQRDDEFSVDVNGLSLSFPAEGRCLTELAIRATLVDLGVRVAQFGVVQSEGTLDVVKMTQVVVSRRSEFSKRVAEERAAAGAQGFYWPPTTCVRDSTALKTCGGDFVRLVRSVQDLHRRDRFNEERCLRLFGTDPEFDTLMTIARTGAVVDVSPDFVINAVPERVRSSNVRLENCLSMHCVKLWEKGRGLLLPCSLISTTQYTLLNKSSPHWVPKPGVVEGRFLCDLSNRKERFTG